MPKIIDYEFKRGDTKVLNKFRPTDNNGTPLKLSATDQIYFTMKKGTNGNAVVKKSINNGIILEDDGYYHITMHPDDTQDLSNGIYVYDIQLNLNLTNLFVKTLIEGEITLLQDITTRRDY